MPVLFLSRGTMSGVQNLVEQFSACSGMRCISREDLIEVISKCGDWAIKVIRQLSEATSAYDQFSKLRRPYIVLMRQALLGEIYKDNILYHGFSGHLLLPRIQHNIRVRIDAPIELRVPPTMEHLGCDEESAKNYIREMDEQRVRWGRFTYGRDIRDPLLYDINFNLGNMPMKVVCDILKALLSEPDLQATAKSQKQVEQLLKSTNVEAALVCDSRTRNFEIHAQVQNESIHLLGPYLDDEQISLVTEIARKTAMLNKIDYSPGYASTLDINA